MILQSAKEKIEEFINQNLDSESHFLVQVNVGNEKSKSGIVQILIDSDSGITIEECAVYSRKTGKFLEENELFENAYTLEVASPGLDFPLGSERQFLKNIGRSVLVDLKSETSTKEGKLISYENEMIQLEVEEKLKGKKTQKKLVEIPVNQIIKAKVTVSFK
jgi:ribosome maturation factor RimP